MFIYSSAIQGTCKLKPNLGLLFTLDLFAFEEVCRTGSNLIELPESLEKALLKDDMPDLDYSEREDGLPPVEEVL